MDEHGTPPKRLGLVALALAALSSPLVVKDAAAAGANPDNHTATPPGHSNGIVLGRDGKPQNNNYVLGHDGKPQNNNYVVGRDGKPHNNNFVTGHDVHKPGENNGKAYRKP